MRPVGTTPGPWEKGQDGSVVARALRVVRIATVVGTDGDLRLITAAPDLYNACIMALEELEGFSHVHADVKIALREAIKKARGK